MDIKRMNYFKGEFLHKEDFKDEQQYHVNMLKMHNKSLHTWGIADGFDVTFVPGEKKITVTKGMAIDVEGRQIILVEDKEIDLSASTGTTLYLSVSYKETLTDPRDETGIKDYTRITEEAEIKYEKDMPSDTSTQLILAKVILNSDKTIKEIDKSERKNAGVVGGDLEAKSLSFSLPIARGQWPRIEGVDEKNPGLKITSNKVDFTGDVNIEGTLNGNLAIDIVGTNQILNNAITAAKIVDGNVETSKLANSAVTEPKIADNAVSNRIIQNNAVTTVKIANGNVETTKLADNAVTTAKIANNAVTAAKIADGNVETSKLANNAVTEPKIANNAVSNRTIQDNAVTAAKIADGNVGTTKLADNAVTTTKIQDGSISIKKLKTQLVVDTVTTIPASSRARFCLYAVSLTNPRVADLLIKAYSTTPNAEFEWREGSTTRILREEYYIYQFVSFHNLGNFPIEVKIKIYEIRED